MLVNLRDMCAIAEQYNMAIGSFNTPNMESLRATIIAAEETHLPVMISHAQVHEPIRALERPHLRASRPLRGPLLHASRA